ncbi:hypothetical protein [Pseudomonas sp. PB3P13]
MAAITLGTFSFVTAEFLPVGVLPEVASSFAFSPGHVGLMVTLPGLLAAIGAPGVLLLAGNINRRSVLIFCIVPSVNEEASSTVFITIIQLAIAAGSGFGGGIVDRFGLATVFFAGALLYVLAIVFLSTSLALARRA